MPPYIRIRHNETVHKGIKHAASKAGIKPKVWCAQMVTKALDDPRMFNSKRTVKSLPGRKPYPSYVNITMDAKTHQRVKNAASKAGVPRNSWCSNVVQTALSSRRSVSTLSPTASARGSRRTTTAGPGRIAPLAEDGYLRATGRTLKLILPRHNALSNRFKKWLELNGYSQVLQETGLVDIEFMHFGELCRAELKVCYGINSTHAIREALGQLLEYNYFGIREPANRWLVILDKIPTSEDKEFVDRLRTKLSLPVHLGWEENRGFTLLHW